MIFALLPLAVLLASTDQRAQTVTVFAAASLKEAFTTIALDFEKAHPGTTVRLNFAGSQTLAAQILHGAPADVFASASMKNLKDAKPDKSTVRVFALNRLTIVVRVGYRAMKVPKDLASVPRIVVADPSVPAGQYAEEFLTKAQKRYGAGWAETTRTHIVSREADVRSVLAKVRLGEADAGIVYVSDAVSARGHVDEVSIPKELNSVAEYPVAVTSRPSNRAGAVQFVKALLAPESQRTLELYGFVSPTLHRLNKK